ncbi:MAG: hypothetical protein KGI54_16845 [Pseudomonadota bacterium]|nr:hypothetical protein [Pseudomonadota bacterium]
MKRPTMRQREQAEEMQRQRIRASLIANFPQQRLCESCQQRDPWVDICPECRAKAEEYAGD